MANTSVSISEEQAQSTAQMQLQWSRFILPMVLMPEALRQQVLPRRCQPRQQGAAHAVDLELIEQGLFGRGRQCGGVCRDGDMHSHMAVSSRGFAGGGDDGGCDDGNGGDVDDGDDKGVDDGDGCDYDSYGCTLRW